MKQQQRWMKFKLLCLPVAAASRRDAWKIKTKNKFVVCYHYSLDSSRLVNVHGCIDCCHSASKQIVNYLFFVS